jgi:hypothetical protein
MVKTVKRRQLKNKRTKRRTRKAGMNFTSSFKKSIGMASRIDKSKIDTIFNNANLAAFLSQKEANNVKRGQGYLTTMVKIFVVHDNNGRILSRTGDVHDVHGSNLGNKIQPSQNWM